MILYFISLLYWLLSILACPSQECGEEEGNASGSIGQERPEEVKSQASPCKVYSGGGGQPDRGERGLEAVHLDGLLALDDLQQPKRSNSFWDGKTTRRQYQDTQGRKQLPYAIAHLPADEQPRKWDICDTIEG